MRLNVIPMDIPTVAGMQDFVKAEIARWGQVVQKAGIAQSE